jgi:outer membrane receptor protein involved in Fe transport
VVALARHLLPRGMRGADPRLAWAALGFAFAALPALAQAQAQPGSDGAPSGTSPSAGGSAPLQEVTVTGTRLARSGVTAPTPVTVVGAERIQDLGAPNIGSVLNTLPSFRASTSPQTSNISPHDAGTTQADLRGLGPNRTLVLVNGRRFVPSTQEGTVDLNQIPTILIDRTEVVTGGASAAYGSDAVAGVVNVITKTNLQGMIAELQYGETEYGDGKDYLAGIAGGTGFASGRGHVTGAFEYEGNHGTGGCYTRAWCAQEYQDITNPGSTDPNVPGHKLIGYPANNSLPDTHTVTAVPGGLILSGPLHGTAFQPNGAPYPFRYGLVFPNNLTFMYGGQGNNGFIASPLMVIPTDRYVSFLGLDYGITDDLKASLELSYGRVTSEGRGPQTRDFFPGGSNAITIHGDNPYLPAGVKSALLGAGESLTAATTFTLGRMGDDFGDTDNLTAMNLYRVLVGLKGSIGEHWTWDAYYQFGTTHSDQTVENNRIQEQIAGVPLAPGQPSRIQLAADAVVNPTSGQIVCRSTLTNPANGCVPVDLFGLYNWSAAADAYLYGTATQTQDFTQHVAALNVQGDLFHTWAGTVPLAAGVEYRQNETSTTADPISATNGFYVFNSSIIGGRIRVSEEYLETDIPLAAHEPWAHSLSLNGAVRFTDYNTSGSVTTWKYGAVYEPTGWLRLRATRSRDIRAPNVSELYSPLTNGFQTINGILTPTVSGGNPKLTPETASTTTAGFAIMGSGAFEGLRASVDYYDIDIDNVIATLTGQVLVNRCVQQGAYCDQVTFNPDGSIGHVSTLYQNLNRLRTNGFDIEVGYHLALTALSPHAGALDFSLLATRLEHLKTTDVTGLTIDRAGVTGNNVSGGGAGLPYWQLDNLVTYTRGPLSLTWETRWIDSGRFDATLIGPDEPGYNVDLPNSINTNHVAGVVYFNVGARYRLSVLKDRTLELFAGIQNLLNRSPPVAPSNQGSSNLILFDPLGRTYRAGIRMAF